jgi:hypothetical protein
MSLAKAIEGATAAGEWAVVLKLAGELQERRLEARRRRLGEVALIDDARRQSGR